MPDATGFGSLWAYRDLLLQGVALTLQLIVMVLAVSLPLGVVLSLIRVYRVPVLHGVVTGWVYFVRSIPVVMLIALVHFAVMPVFHPGVSVMVSAAVALILSTGVYFAEIFRGGFSSIHPEEQDAAISLGLSFVQRQVRVVLPLVFLRTVPALINQCVTLIKDTSLASLIGVMELTRSAEIIAQRTLHEATLLLFIAAVYFMVCFTLSCLANGWRQRAAGA